MALVVLSIAIAANYDNISVGIHKLYGVKGVREFTHDIMETAVPLDPGPIQELESPWTGARPELDGVIKPGEWDDAVSVEFDGADKIRPGIAIGARDSTEDRATSGTLPRSSNHATMRIMNGSALVYVAVEVYDDIPAFDEGDIAKQDSIEVHMRWGDEGDEAAERHFFLLRGDGGADVGGIPGQYAASANLDGDGCTIELSFRVPDPQRIVDFDLGIHDSDPSPAGESRHFYEWNGTGGSILKDGREYGRIHLATQP